MILIFHTFWDQFPFEVRDIPSCLDLKNVSLYLNSFCTETKFPFKEFEAEIALVLSTDYIDDLGLLSYFKEYIENANRSSKFFSKDRTSEKYLAPVVSLCQRSGSGKTRLLLESGRQHFPLVYISFGKLLQSPKCVTDFLKGLASTAMLREKSETKSLVFVAALIKFVLEKFSAWTERTMKQQADRTFFTELVTLFQPVGVAEKSEELDALWEKIISEVNSNVPNAKDYTKGIFDLYIQSRLPKLLIAMDEAKELLNDDPDTISAFRIIRKSLSGLSTNSYKHIPDHLVTLIVADTYSSITNFAPVSHPFFSGRDVKSVGYLIPPFFLLSGFDVMAKKYLSECKAVHDQHEKANWFEFLNSRDQNAFEFVKLGSPLWGASIIYKHLDNSEESIDWLISFAAFKLEASSSLTLPMYYIAALTARASLTIIPRSSLANELVAGNMAQLDMISANRDSVFVSYPSDVMLAQGAASLIKRNPLKALEALDDHLCKSQISLGDGGESVVELLLLAAVDELDRQFRSISVEDFIRSLFGEDVAKPLLEIFSNKPILKGKLFFNHFVKLSESAVAGNLAYYFTRGAAISGYPVQFGWDICIPVCLEDGRLTAIFVQVKNYKDLLTETYIIGLMQKMRLAGLQLLNPVEYCTLWNSEKERKPNNVELGKRVREIGADDQNLEDLALNICMNLLQGDRVPSDATGDSSDGLPAHISLVQATHNFVCVQGLTSHYFPNFWGNGPEEKAACISILQRLLVPRSDYSRQLSYDYNSTFVKTFNRFDHGHTRGTF